MFGSYCLMSGWHVSVAMLVIWAACWPCEATEEGFIDLLADGLDGWVAEADENEKSVWTVDGGVLHCNGNGLGFLRYDRELVDFTFRVEFRMSKGCNSGIGIRGDKFTGTRKSRPSLTGYEVQILDDAGRDPHAYGSCSLYRYLAPTENATKPHGQWNSVEITCRGPRIKIVVNGKTVHDIDQRDFDEIKDKPISGFLSVQNHGHVIDFRNLSLKELPVAN